MSGRGRGKRAIQAQIPALVSSSGEFSSSSSSRSRPSSVDSVQRFSSSSEEEPLRLPLALQPLRGGLGGAAQPFGPQPIGPPLVLQMPLLATLA